MTWQNPWALLGLLALALPVFIHLLSRKRAVLQKFPSLRFLNATRLRPTRSPHLTDIPLLLVRLAILTIATLALTGPLWLSARRKQTLNSTVARIIVVDTSASMMRAGSGGRTTADSARAFAQAMAAESKASLIVETSAPSEVLAGASAWLRAQSVRGEIVVLSDFQVGTVDAAAVGRVAAGFGVRMVRVPSPSGATGDSGFSTTSGRVVAAGDSNATRAEWSSAATTLHDSAFVLLAPANERALVDAAERAALESSPHVLADTARRLAIAFDGAPGRAGIVASAKAPDHAWMSNTLIAVQRDEVLSAAAAQSPLSDTAIAPPFAVLIRTQQGNPVVYAAQSSVNGATRLVFFHRGDASGLTTPALLAAVGEAAARNSGIRENELLTVSDASLRKLERAPGETGESETASDRAGADRAGLSDARWIWLAVLVLLALETWMRRNTDMKVPAEVA